MASEIDREALSVVQLGLYDEAIPCRDFWLYQIGRVLIALTGEHSEQPRLFFYREFDDEADARDFLHYLRASDAEKSVEQSVNKSEKSVELISVDELEELWLLQ
jgi:hypothetical protein